MDANSLTVVIPTYQRGPVLLETLERVRMLRPAPGEIVVVDQTPEHPASVADALSALHTREEIRWMRLPAPSIPHAMNAGIGAARHAVILFLDDDVVPAPNLIAAHLEVHARGESRIVAGQVLQPGEEPVGGDAFVFSSSRRHWVRELMAGNFSISRQLALALGGFDENFVAVAYRFETEFAERAAASGERILFVPEASIRHLRAPRGGTRAYGDHLRTMRPGHAVGAYYYVIRSAQVRSKTLGCLQQLVRAVATRHHLTHPWWIPGTLWAELRGLVWALTLARRGPRLLSAVEAVSAY